MMETEDDASVASAVVDDSPDKLEVDLVADVAALPSVDVPAVVGGITNAPTAPVASPPDPPKKRSRMPAKYRSRKPSDMPRRPLTAYNIFFRDQRAQILAERKAGQVSSVGGESEKKGGAGLFETLGKLIAQRWKAVTPEMKEHYRIESEKDTQRYREEMLEYKRKIDEAKKAEAKKLKREQKLAKQLEQKQKKEADKGANVVAAVAEFEDDDDKSSRTNKRKASSPKSRGKNRASSEQQSLSVEKAVALKAPPRRSRSGQRSSDDDDSRGSRDSSRSSSSRKRSSRRSRKHRRGESPSSESSRRRQRRGWDQASGKVAAVDDAPLANPSVQMLHDASLYPSAALAYDGAAALANMGPYGLHPQMLQSQGRYGLFPHMPGYPPSQLAMEQQLMQMQHLRDFQAARGAPSMGEDRFSAASMMDRHQQLLELEIQRRNFLALQQAQAGAEVNSNNRNALQYLSDSSIHHLLASGRLPALPGAQYDRQQPHHNGSAQGAADSNAPVDGREYFEREQQQPLVASRGLVIPEDNNPGASSMYDAYPEHQNNNSRDDHGSQGSRNSAADDGDRRAHEYRRWG